MSMGAKTDEPKVRIANLPRVFVSQVRKTYDADVLDGLEAHPDCIECLFSW